MYHCWKIKYDFWICENILKKMAAKINKLRRDLQKQLNPSGYLNFFAGCSPRRSEYEVRKVIIMKLYILSIKICWFSSLWSCLVCKYLILTVICVLKSFYESIMITVLKMMITSVVRMNLEICIPFYCGECIVSIHSNHLIYIHVFFNHSFNCWATNTSIEMLSVL